VLFFGYEFEEIRFFKYREELNEKRGFYCFFFEGFFRRRDLSFLDLIAISIICHFSKKT